MELRRCNCTLNELTGHMNRIKTHPPSVARHAISDHHRLGASGDREGISRDCIGNESVGQAMETIPESHEQLYDHHDRVADAQQEPGGPYLCGVRSDLVCDRRRYRTPCHVSKKRHTQWRSLSTGKEIKGNPRYSVPAAEHVWGEYAFPNKCQGFRYLSFNRVSFPCFYLPRLPNVLSSLLFPFSSPPEPNLQLPQLQLRDLPLRAPA